jgi:hypothetical protein
LHIGGDSVLRSGAVIGLFDLDGCSRRQDTRRFLQNRENDGRLSQAAEGILPRSFVVTADDRTYLSPATTATLKKRLNAAV